MQSSHRCQRLPSLLPRRLQYTSALHRALVPVGLWYSWLGASALPVLVAALFQGLYLLLKSQQVINRQANSSAGGAGP